MSLLRSLEPFKNFVVVGGGWWWWLRVILVLSFGLSQAEQYTMKIRDGLKKKIMKFSI